MRINWHRHIDDALGLCIALAFYLFVLAAGIWWVTR